MQSLQTLCLTGVLILAEIFCTFYQTFLYHFWCFFVLLSILYVSTDMRSLYSLFLLFVNVLCSGRLMQGKSQSSFSVSFKNMKKSPSLQSLDDLSIDSYSLEDCDSYSLLERGTCTQEHHVLLMCILLRQSRIMFVTTRGQYCNIYRFGLFLFH